MGKRDLLPFFPKHGDVVKSENEEKVLHGQVAAAQACPLAMGHPPGSGWAEGPTGLWQHREVQRSGPLLM